MKMKKKIVLLLVLAAALLLTGCNSYSTFAYTCSRQEAIPAQEKAEVDALQERLLSAIETGDVSAVETIASDEFLQSAGEVSDVLTAVKWCMGSTPELMDEYYARFRSTSTGERWIAASINADYWLRVVPTSPYYYYKLTTFENDTVTYLMVSVFSKKADTWSLSSLSVGEYLLGGMDGRALYEKCSGISGSGYELPAGIYGECAARVVCPCGIIYYKDNDKMLSGIKAVSETAQRLCPFPLALAGEGESFEVIDISSSVTQQGVIPVVSYLTSADLSDEQALSEQAERVKAALCDTFKGMAETFEKIYIRAYNDAPTQSEEEYPSHIILA